VCDEAYLALRNLLHVSTGHESMMDFLVGSKAFLWRPNKSKDALIENYKKTGRWVSLNAVEGD
jgi:hypothetical protein